MSRSKKKSPHLETPQQDIQEILRRLARAAIGYLRTKEQKAELHREIRDYVLIIYSDPKYLKTRKGLHHKALARGSEGNEIHWEWEKKLERITGDLLQALEFHGDSSMSPKLKRFPEAPSVTGTRRKLTPAQATHTARRLRSKKRRTSVKTILKNDHE